MKKESKKELLSYILIIIFVILIKTFIVTPVRVNGESMINTLQDKEIMILNKTAYWKSDIKRFDIVVVNYNGTKLIKRVIGLPGEKVEYKDNTLYVNDKEVKESFTKGDTYDYSFNRYEKLPKNCYFVVGDNREDSLDSRYLGCMDKGKILGEAKLVIFPFKNVRKVQ